MNIKKELFFEALINAFRALFLHARFISIIIMAVLIFYSLLIFLFSFEALKGMPGHVWGLSLINAAAGLLSSEIHIVNLIRILIVLLFNAWLIAVGTRMSLDIEHGGKNIISHLYMINPLFIFQAMFALTSFYLLAMPLFFFIRLSFGALTIGSLVHIIASFLSPIAIFILIRLSFWSYYLIDKKENLISAFKHSWQTTQQYFWELLIYILILSGIFYCFGILGYPFMFLSLAHIYRSLLAEYNAQHPDKITTYN